MGELFWVSAMGSGALGGLAARAAIRWRFGLVGGHDHTLREIGDRTGLSRDRVRRIERGAIQRLRGLAEVCADGAVRDERNQCISWGLTLEASGEAR